MIFAFFALLALLMVSLSAACSTELIAGQTYKVGSVEVEVIDNNLKVTFQTDRGWCLTDTHFAIASSADDLPSTRTGNPKLGDFPYECELDPEVCDTCEIIITDSPCTSGPCYFAAHVALATGCVDEDDTVFGFDRLSDYMYEVTLDPVAALVYDGLFSCNTGPCGVSNENSPNGHAHWTEGEKLFYSLTPFGGDDQVSQLWSYDIKSGTQTQELASLEGMSAGATFVADANDPFSGGCYFYFKNASPDLYKACVSGGSFASPVLACTLNTAESSAGVTGPKLRFGDFVYDPMNKDLYGIAQVSNAPQVTCEDGSSKASVVQFRMNLDCSNYLDLVNTGGHGWPCGQTLQVAVGRFGDLYAHSTQFGTFYKMDSVTLSEPLFPLAAEEIGDDDEELTDLASGPLCPTLDQPESQTAWGAGDAFGGANWATKFNCTL